MAQPATPLPVPQPARGSGPSLLSRLLDTLSPDELRTLSEQAAAPDFADQFQGEVQRRLDRSASLAERHAQLERMEAEKGVKPFDYDEWMARPHDPMTPEEWESYMAAINEGRRKPR